MIRYAPTLIFAALIIGLGFASACAMDAVGRSMRTAATNVGWFAASVQHAIDHTKVEAGR